MEIIILCLSVSLICILVAFYFLNEALIQYRKKIQELEKRLNMWNMRGDSC